MAQALLRMHKMIASRLNKIFEKRILCDMLSHHTDNSIRLFTSPSPFIEALCVQTQHRIHTEKTAWDTTQGTFSRKRNMYNVHMGCKRRASYSQRPRHAGNLQQEQLQKQRQLQHRYITSEFSIVNFPLLKYIRFLLHVACKQAAARDEGGRSKTNLLYNMNTPSK